LGTLTSDQLNENHSILSELKQHFEKTRSLIEFIQTRETLKVFFFFFQFLRNKQLNNI